MWTEKTTSLDEMLLLNSYQYDSLLFFSFKDWGIMVNYIRFCLIPESFMKISQEK